jgi:hypothetical protein
MRFGDAEYRDGAGGPACRFSDAIDTCAKHRHALADR